jgi:hypothetical protein
MKEALAWRFHEKKSEQKLMAVRSWKSLYQRSLREIGRKGHYMLSPDAAFIEFHSFSLQLLSSGLQS